MLKENAKEDYVQSVYNMVIKWEDFEKNLEMFSKFINSTDEDYKYNGTYLNEFIEDFKNFYSCVKGKYNKYILILNKLKYLEGDFVIIVDNIYTYSNIIGERFKSIYIGLDIKKLKSEKIEVKVKYKRKEKDFLFCKEYFKEDKDLEEQVFDDVMLFYSNKVISKEEEV